MSDGGLSGVRTGFVTQMGMDPVDAMDAAGARGFDFLEVMMDGNGERTRLDDRRDELTAALADNDLDLVVHLPFKLDIGSPFDHVRDGALQELDAAMETAAALGAEKAVVHADTEAWSGAWDIDDIQPHILHALRDLTGTATDHGLELCVENVPGQFFDIYDFDLVFAETDAAMTLDTGHARMAGMTADDMALFVEQYHGRISHVHLNDTRRPEDEHLPFGAGDLDFETLFAALADNDWSGTMSLEVFTWDYDYIGISQDRLRSLL